MELVSARFVGKPEKLLLVLDMGSDRVYQDLLDFRENDMLRAQSACGLACRTEQVCREQGSDEKALRVGSCGGNVGIALAVVDLADRHLHWCWQLRAGPHAVLAASDRSGPCFCFYL